MSSTLTSLAGLPEPLSKDEVVHLSSLIFAGRSAGAALAAGDVGDSEADELERQVAEGEKAIEKLYVSNLRLVSHWANIYARKVPSYARTTIGFDDLFSEGAIGLKRACELFDGTRGYAFSTYATYWVKQAMMRSIDSSSAIRIPTYLSAEVQRAARSEDSCGRTAAVDAALKAISMSSLDAQIAEDFTLADTVEAEGCGPEFELFGSVKYSNLAGDVDALIEKFSERDQRIMRMRLGIGETPMSYREISREVGVGSNGVRYIINRRLHDLRKGLVGMGYQPS